MPQTATLEAIKAYQEQMEKGKIKPGDLPPCSRCELDSVYFKEHAFRERQFLVIVEWIIQTICCSLLRFKCPGCGKTVTWYPGFAMPYKRYTVSAMMDFSKAYVENDKKTYGTAAMIDYTQPAYPENGKMMVPSTIYRFITTLAGFENISARAIDLILQKDPMSTLCRELGQTSVGRQKYKSPGRKSLLIRGKKLLRIERVFKALFNTSVFTRLAIREAFR